MFVVPVLLLGGVALGLIMKGIIYVPGLSPKPVKVIAASEDPTGAPLTKLLRPIFAASDRAAAIVPPKKATVAPVKEPVQTDPVAGSKKLAAVWTSLEPPALAEMTKTWKPEDLAPVLVRMDEEAVAGYLSALPPDRASLISTAVAAEAARLKTKPAPAGA